MALGCDQNVVHVALPPHTWGQPARLQLGIHWEDFDNHDLGITVLAPDGSEHKSDAFFTNGEIVEIRNAVNGTYRVNVTSSPPGVQYVGRVEVEYDVVAAPLRLLLPNLSARPPGNFHFTTGAYYDEAGSEVGLTSCYPEETLEDGATKCMRFDHQVQNKITGDGDFELKFQLETAAADRSVLQRVYRSDGSFEDRQVGEYDFHASHGHHHLMNYAISRLWAATPSGRKLGGAPVGRGPTTRREPVTEGEKLGFCMYDSNAFDFESKGNTPRRYAFEKCFVPGATGSTAVLNGMTRGWGDTYPWFVAGSYIEIAGVPDGNYILEFEVDPANLIEETDETDNLASTHIRICQGGTRVETVGVDQNCQ